MARRSTKFKPMEKPIDFLLTATAASSYARVSWKYFAKVKLGVVAEQRSKPDSCFVVRKNSRDR